MLSVRNKIDTLLKISERHTPNNEYENFVDAPIEAEAKGILIQQTTKSKV